VCRDLEDEPTVRTKEWERTNFGVKKVWQQGVNLRVNIRVNSGGKEARA
jgi:hypothetical protein